MSASVIPPPFRIGLSRSEAASLIGVSPGTFDGMVSRGDMPRAKRIGARLVWSREAVEAAFHRLPTIGAPPAIDEERSPKDPDCRGTPPWERRTD